MSSARFGPTEQHGAGLSLKISETQRRQPGHNRTMKLSAMPRAAQDEATLDVPPWTPRSQLSRLVTARTADDAEPSPSAPAEPPPPSPRAKIHTPPWLRAGLVVRTPDDAASASSGSELPTPGVAAAPGSPWERRTFARLTTLARECWVGEAEARPSFATVAGRLQAMLQNESADEDEVEVAIDVSAELAQSSAAV